MTSGALQTDDEKAFSDALSALNLSFATELPERIAEIEQLWSGLDHDTPDQSITQEMHRRVHSLTGSAKIFGFPDVSTVAREIESLLASHAKHGTAVPIGQRETIQLLIERLRAASSNRQDTVPADTQPQSSQPSHQAASVETVREVYLLDSNVEQADSLLQQLSQYDYRVRHFATADSLTEELEVHLPSVLIANVSSDPASQAAIAALRKMAATLAVPSNLIFLSDEDSVALRLAAVRAGGSAFFVRPTPIAALIDCLDGCIGRAQPAPYRVMIVEDDPIQGEYLSKILDSNSIVSCVVHEYRNVMDTLVNFNPDVVLMDMYLPGCRGDELARVIRQTDAFMSLPIAFLSVERDFDRQLAAMGHGGDEFLTKPIAPAHLLSVVNARVERYRELRTLMMHDSLTGLVNHSHLQQQVEVEASKSFRYKRPLGFAMIDVDDFKQVNDRYGHIVGDRVLKNLARYLRQRLRRSDIVGRYGGEEFAVILSDTDGATAYRVLQELCEGFSTIPIETNNGTFYCTFSAGVASIPEHNCVRDLLHAADLALYGAKSNGRNCVVRDDRIDTA